MSKKTTKQQENFKTGLQKLNKYDNIKKERLLLPEEEMEINEINNMLWADIMNYGKSLVSKMTQNYQLPNDAYSDLYQKMALIFFEKYRSYNPLQTTPTTYFGRYFKQVISDYLCKNIHKLSSYDAKNIIKVKKAIAHYESKGIECTKESLCILTGLSPKVLQSTIFYSNISCYTSIKEAYNLQSHDKTPEEAYIEKDNYFSLMKILKENTSKKELELLLMRINLDERKEMSYEEIAKRTKMSTNEVKKTLKLCISRLSQNESILKEFSK